jgi:hypothetical protein
MKHTTSILVFVFSFIFFKSQAQDSTRIYNEAYEIVDSMLTGKNPLSFKKAVFTTENAYLDGQMSFFKFDNEIKLFANIIRVVKSSNSVIYNESDKENIEINASIYKVMTDTIAILADTSNLIIHYPFSYDFDDMWGQTDWGSMFVSKLLVTRKGNCHSLPYLYKILAEEFNVQAYLAFAPNHIYIKNYCKKTGWYNTELTSATFPVDAWIMASGYVHLDAIRNELYMDTLSLQQSVAYCLLDLAHGYQRKFGKANPDFVIKCCNTVLKYHPVNVNAMLTKAEAQKSFIDAKMKEKGVKSPKELFTDDSIKIMYSDMEQTYVRLHQLGYRRMPEEMYMQWMGMLKNEPEKYIDKK